jgi:hypothetical protein
MKSRLCLLLLLSPSFVVAQQPATPKWALGAELGYTATYSQIIDDLPKTLDENTMIVVGDPSVGNSGGDGVFGVHVGRMLNSSLRTDALLSLNLVGVGFGEVIATEQTQGGGTYTTAQYDHGTGSAFLTTGARFVAEPSRMQFGIRPRAALSAVWQWTKGPAATVSAGFSAGDSRTRFTLDAGEQFSRLRYDRLFKTYLKSDNALVGEERRNGTKRLRGFSMRIGVDHYVF